MDDLSCLERILRRFTKNTRKHKGENTGRTRENHETDIESITGVLDHRTQRDTYDPQSTKVRIQRTVLLLTEVLMVFPRKGS